MQPERTRPKEGWVRGWGLLLGVPQPLMRGEPCLRPGSLLTQTEQQEGFQHEVEQLRTARVDSVLEVFYLVAEKFLISLPCKRRLTAICR